MPGAKPLLELRSITKEFAGNRVLTDVSFTLEAGQILGLVGENGAGKTTLMNILFGMNVIWDTGGYGGTIVLDGEDLCCRNPYEALDAGIGMVHQEFSLIPGFTATENILLNREPTRYNPLVEVFDERMRTLDRAAMREQALGAIRKLGVSLSEGTLVSEMPVGHKQFTEIARELVRRNMRILVLDEPTAVLTESEAEVLMLAVRNLAAQGIAVVFISHRLDEVVALCDKVVVLRDGQVVKQGPVAGTSVEEIAEAMVGRSLAGGTARSRETALATQPVLRVEHLWVDMPGETVRDVGFEVLPGEIFGIGGLAGQGKLGIPNGIMGLYKAGGRVEFEGREIPLNDPRAALAAGLAFVSEDRRGVGLLLEEPVGWNIAITAIQTQDRFVRPLLGGLIKWRDEEAISALAQEYIEALQIRCTGAGQPVAELSGGNQQKICLAKAFALKPRLLFVSEPTRGIDVGAKKLVLDTIRRYNRENGTTVVMISSELEELRSLCDRIAIVDEGRLTGIRPAATRSTEFGLLMVGRAR